MAALGGIPGQIEPGEESMLGKARWEQVHRLAENGMTLAEIARQLEGACPPVSIPVAK